MFVGFAVFICHNIHTCYIERIWENSKIFQQDQTREQLNDPNCLNILHWKNEHYWEKLNVTWKRILSYCFIRTARTDWMLIHQDDRFIPVTRLIEWSFLRLSCNFAIVLYRSGGLEGDSEFSQGLVNFLLLPSLPSYSSAMGVSPILLDHVIRRLRSFYLFI